MKTSEIREAAKAHTRKVWTEGVVGAHSCSSFEAGYRAALNEVQMFAVHLKGAYHLPDDRYDLGARHALGDVSEFCQVEDE